MAVAFIMNHSLSRATGAGPCSYGLPHVICPVLLQREVLLSRLHDHNRSTVSCTSKAPPWSTGEILAFAVMGEAIAGVRKYPPLPHCIKLVPHNMVQSQCMLHEQSRGLRSYVPNAVVFWRNIHPLPHGAIILEVGQGRPKNNVGQQKQVDPLHVV